MKKKSASQSAFFKLRLVIAVLFCFGAITLVLFAQPRTPSGQSGNSQPIVHAQYLGVMPVVKFDISPPLRSMKPLVAKECRNERERRAGADSARTGWSGCAGYGCAASARQNRNTGSDHHFDGNRNLCGCAPPDPNGAVGPNHVVTMANLHFQIFNKIRDIAVWSGSEQYALGRIWWRPARPIMPAIRSSSTTSWPIAGFLPNSLSAAPPFFECVALSQTSDPLGSYYRWAIATGGGNNFPDYPKAGMWPDAYYFSTREFAGGSTFVGVARMRLIAFRRWSAIPIRPWLAFWRRQPRHTWLETACCQVILMASDAAAVEAQTISSARRITTALTARQRMR